MTRGKKKLILGHVEQEADPLSDLWQGPARHNRVGDKDLRLRAGRVNRALEQGRLARAIQASRATRSRAATENDTPRESLLPPARSGR